MANIITRYYQGVLQQVRSEVDLINSLFQHQGMKGEGNERILRDLLRRFISKKYGIGTGIIIDKDGNVSRQCDIIIYDTFLYPSLLSLSAIHLFPVDIVYATVEVKTTLTKSSSKEALENIKSVRELKLLPSIWTTSNVRPDGVGYTVHTPELPMGTIFAYNSLSQNVETLKNWFASDETSISYCPTLIACLDHGIIGFGDEKNRWQQQPTAGMKLNDTIIPLRDEQGQIIKLPRNRNTYIENGIHYPAIKQYKGENIVIDQSRILLLFMLYLQEFLSWHDINPSISFVDYYFDKEDIEEGIDI